MTMTNLKQWIFKPTMILWIKCCFFIFAFGFFTSCNKSPPQDLVIKITPEDSFVLDINAYTCAQIVRGIGPGSIEGPAVAGPIVVFNRMSLEWKKTTELYIAQAIFKFTSTGITGGESTCDITAELPALFEVGRYDKQSPANIFVTSTFGGKGSVDSNPNCRVVCNIPLVNKDVPEINGSGELTIKAFELTNKGQDNERYYRVKSKFRVKISP